MLVLCVVVDFLAQVSDGIREDAFPEVFVDVSAAAALSFDQVAGNVKESPDLEGAVDETKRSDSDGLDEGADGDAVDEDEDPQKD